MRVGGCWAKPWLGVDAALAAGLRPASSTHQAGAESDAGGRARAEKSGETVGVVFSASLERSTPSWDLRRILMIATLLAVAMAGSFSWPTSPVPWAAGRLREMAEGNLNQQINVGTATKSGWPNSSTMASRLNYYTRPAELALTFMS